MSDYLLVSQREDDQYIEKLKAERDALARRAAELEAALRAARAKIADVAGHLQSRHLDCRVCDGLQLSVCNERRAIDRALASSGGTGAANVVRRSFETLAATRDEGAGNEAASGKHTSPGTHETGEVKGRSGDGADWSPAKTQAANPALPSREQAGRADSSDSEPLFLDINEANAEIVSLRERVAAIRREAIEEHVGDFLADVRAEVERAYAKHGRDQWGRHEFYGVLKEEVDELWDAIKNDEPQERVRAEMVQVAAMCLRYDETGDRYRIRALAGDAPTK